MANKFWESFARSFDPAGAARFLAADAIHDRNREKEREEQRLALEEAERKRQQTVQKDINIFQQLQKGETFQYTPRGGSRMRPMTQTEKIGRVGQISDDVMRRDFLKGIFDPEKISMPEITEETFIKANTVEGLQSLPKDFIVPVTVKKKGDQILSTTFGEPKSYIQTKKDSDGNPYKVLTDDAFKEYDKLKKEYLGALAVQSAYKQGSQPYYMNPFTNSIEFYTENEINEGVNVSKNKLGAMVDMNISDDAKNYMTNNWSSVSEDPTEVPIVIGKRLMEDYHSGRLEPSTFAEVYFKYISTFGVDPAIKYAR